MSDLSPARRRGCARFTPVVAVVLVLLAAMSCSSAPEQLRTAPSPAAAPAPGTATVQTTTSTATTTTASTTTSTTVPITTTVTTPTTPVVPKAAPTTPRVVPVAPTTVATTATTTRAAPAAPPLPAGPTSVFVEGDSVLLGTTETMPAALVGWQVTMDTVGSRRLTQALPVLQDRRNEIGRVVVIQLGNNYIPGEGGSFSGQIDQAMTILDGVDRVVWVTLAEKLSGRAQLNDDIRAAAGRWPNIVVAEWAPLVATHPDYAPGDGLHLSGSGRVALAELVAAAVGPAPG